MKHPFHIVDLSPWPLAAGLSTFVTLSGAITYMHHVTGAGLLLIGVLSLVYTLTYWWRDVVREGTYEGVHTTAVQRGLRYGMLLFIFSEVLFFLAFFWGFFHSSITPAIELGNIWPPKGIEAFDPWALPFFNTLILLASGATVTWSHHSIQKGERQGAIIGLVITIALGISFTILQAHEYQEASFGLSSGIYGSTFYMATGFHGLHVILGSVFLTVCLYRMVSGHFTSDHHVGYEAAIWYWHFVDVVWLFLFASIYWWGS